MTLTGEAHLCLSPSPGAVGSVCASDLHKEERSGEADSAPGPRSLGRLV